MPSLERASSARRIGPWSVLGLVLVPLLIAAGFLWATWDSTDRLDRVQAAVVNLDEPVELDGQTVPLGRQLAGGLVAGPDDEDVHLGRQDGLGRRRGGDASPAGCRAGAGAEAADAGPEAGDEARDGVLVEEDDVVEREHAEEYQHVGGF